MKYAICRIIFSVKPIYNWVDFWCEVWLNCRMMGVKPHLRARLAQRIVHATVIR